MFEVRPLAALALLVLAFAEEVLPDDECWEEGCALNALQRKAVASCHDAVPGDACYKDIMWAKHTGVHSHPHWYPGLTSHSSTAEFQEVVHSHKPERCPVPCGKTADCHTALPGEHCYKDIMWAKTSGIHAHPSWYKGLTSSSTIEDFQADIHSKRPDKCPMPCPAKAEPEAAPSPPVTPDEPEAPETVPVEPGPEIPSIIPIPREDEPEPATAAPTHAPTQAPTEAPEPENEAESDYQNSPCHQIHNQHERESCFQAEIRKEQLEREQRERRLGLNMFVSKRCKAMHSMTCKA